MKREPHLDLDHTDTAVLPSLRRAVLSEWLKQGRRITWTLVVLSLLAHALLLAVIAFFAGRNLPKAEAVIPMHLVMQEPQKPNPASPPPPPPPPPPQSQQQSPPPPPPPKGRLASDELGDPDATEKDPTATHAPASGAMNKKAGEAPPEPSKTEAKPNPADMARPTDAQETEKTESIKQADVPKTQEQLAMGGALAPPETNSDKPTDAESAKPVPKPSQVRLRTEVGGSKKPTPIPDDPDHGGGHKAKYPGPDASRDEYLSYIRDLTDQQLAQTPPQFYQSRDGIITIDVVIRPNGTIVWFSVIKSSGYPDTDHALIAELNGISSFPPLPPELHEQNDAPTHLTFTLPLAALRRSR